ncbi:hypothetical protein BYT27DRAFT_7199785 [Phlegmacium glaucopus]|nr:hypothetical protein BYT27DRAFT_7199785 [Phlegmacium glaucopus]
MVRAFVEVVSEVAAIAACSWQSQRSYVASRSTLSNWFVSLSYFERSQSGSFMIFYVVSLNAQRTGRFLQFRR